MAAQLVKELIDAGIHYGHRVSRWNPKMKPYIFGKRNVIHIINIKETLKGILAARKFVAMTIAGGKDILIAGTKRQARKAVEENAARVGMHWVTDRWLGGTLTNFREIRKRIGRLEQLEQLETDGLLDNYSKKEGSALRREIRKIRRNLGGLRKMERLPGVLFVIDQRREVIAVREARKMGIPVICLLDTDSDPDMADIPIPGNDDSMRAIEIVVKELCDAAAEGVHSRVERPDVAAQQQDEQMQRRRPTSRRPMPERAEVQAKPEAAAPTAPAAPASPAEGAPTA